MSPKKIQVGKTYKNRGAGKTIRTVLAMGDEYRPKVYHNSDGSHPDDIGVLYEQNDEKRTIYLKSFAQWAGEEV